MIRRPSLKRPPLLFARIERRLARALAGSPPELVALQRSLLLARLRDSAVHVPAYRALSADPRFASALDDGDPFAALALVPVTTRHDLQTRPADYLHERSGPRRLLREARTSGSSGAPVAVLRDPSTILHEEAFVLRHWRSFGVQPGEPLLSIRWDGPTHASGRALARDRVTGEWRMRAAAVSERSVAALLDRLPSLGLRLLRGYPSALLELVRIAEFLNRYSELRAAGLRLVQLSSETVPPESRARLASAFGAPVAEHYGQAERALLFQECPRGRLHRIDDYAVCEVLDGRLLGTRLFGRGTVLLRYDTGDLAASAPPPPSSPPCPCGWPFPLVSRVLGRSDDALRTSDGRRIGCPANALATAQGAAQVQLEQLAPGRVLVRLLPLPGADGPAIRARLERALRSLLEDPALSLEFRLGEAPLRQPDGRVRAVISRLR
jgi:phenylacetate-CoA ligase